MSEPHKLRDGSSAQNLSALPTGVVMLCRVQCWPVSALAIKSPSGGCTLEYVKPKTNARIHTIDSMCYFLSDIICDGLAAFGAQFEG